MKKIAYILSMALCMVLASCDKEEVRRYDNTAAQDAVGVYEGTWTSVSSSSGTATDYTGTIELAVFKDSLANQCFVYVKCEEAKWNLRGLANVSHAGDDIVFNNENASGNGLGAGFYGRISGDGKATMYFSGTGKEGRKTVIFSNSFAGQKKE